MIYTTFNLHELPRVKALIMKKFLFAVLAISVLIACARPESKMPITDWDASYLDGDAVLVDVRTPGEYEQGHLENALNVDFLDAEFTSRMQEFKPSQTIYVYCKVGGRSAKAASLLDSLGFKKVVDLTGGYDAYKLAQNPVD